MIIGKGGSVIKQLKDDSGAFVQISSKQDDSLERIVVIEGKIEKRNKAFHLLLNKIASDPQHNSVPFLNYPSKGSGIDGSQDYSSYSSINLGYSNGKYRQIIPVSHCVLWAHF